jgi:hypothetical protein
VIDIRRRHSLAGAGVVFGRRQVLVEQPFERQDSGVLGVGRQVALDGGDGFHAPAGLGQLRPANPPAQLVVQHQRHLPGLQQDGESLWIVGPVVAWIEDVLQFGGRQVELLGVGVGDGPPVIDLGMAMRVQLEHQVEQAVGFIELGRRRLAEKKRSGPLQAQVKIDQGQRLGVVGQGVQVERAMHLPEAVPRQPVVRLQL